MKFQTFSYLYFSGGLSSTVYLGLQEPACSPPSSGLAGERPCWAADEARLIRTNPASPSHTGGLESEAQLWKLCECPWASVSVRVCVRENLCLLASVSMSACLSACVHVCVCECECVSIGWCRIILGVRAEKRGGCWLEAVNVCKS